MELFWMVQASTLTCEVAFPPEEDNMAAEHVNRICRVSIKTFCS